MARRIIKPEEDEISDALAFAAKHRDLIPKKTQLPTPISPEDQRGAFQTNVGLALKTQREIMELELDPDDLQFRAIVQAKTTTSGNVLAAAMKADENKLRVVDHEHQRNMYQELKQALEDYQAKVAQKRLEAAGHLRTSGDCQGGTT